MNTSKLSFLFERIINYELFSVNQSPVTILSFLIITGVFIIFYGCSKLIIPPLVKHVIARRKLPDEASDTITFILELLLIPIGIFAAFHSAKN